MGKTRDIYRILVGKSHGKCPLRSLRRRWEDNIKIELEIIVVRMAGGWNWLTMLSSGDYS
jgi:hypothetical protein